MFGWNHSDNLSESNIIICIAIRFIFPSLFQYLNKRLHYIYFVVS